MRTRRDWLAALFAVATGPIERSNRVHLHRGGHVNVRLDRPVLWEVDGGDREPVHTLDIKVRPQAICVLCPRT